MKIEWIKRYGQIEIVCPDLLKYPGFNINS